MDDKERALDRSRNDDPDRERIVTHWFYFKNKDDMDRLILAALDMDYDVQNSWRPAADGEKWGLILSATHVVDTDTLLARYDLLSRFAERFGGEYDGYEYEVLDDQ